MKEYNEKFLEALREANSAPKACSYFMSVLCENGFEAVDYNKSFEINPGGRYVTSIFGNTLVAFDIGNEELKKLKMIATHIDSPALVIKPSPDIKKCNNDILNVEVYGGPILNTWLDRPLSASGRITLKSDKAFEPESRIVDFKRPIATIPNLAIHMNREVNKGVELNRQKDILPIMTEYSQDKNSFLQLLADELGVDENNILDYDMYLYNADAPLITGNYVSSPRLDNVTSTFAAVNAIINSKSSKGINMLVMYDNEEIGSRTKQGAASMAVQYLVKKIYSALNIADYEEAVINGFLVSADVAHATHHNYEEKSDITNKPVMNNGLVIKKACSQGYATDSRAGAVVMQICQKHNIPYQMYVNKSDIPGGSTLGSIMSSLMPVLTVDIGVPMLAMHSARETMGIKDEKYLEEFMLHYYMEEM